MSRKHREEDYESSACPDPVLFQNWDITEISSETQAISECSCVSHNRYFAYWSFYTYIYLSKELTSHMIFNHEDIK